MRRLAAALVTIGALALPATASAGWYWNEPKAEGFLRTHYNVVTADCSGYGKRWHGLYHKFDCEVTTEEGETAEVIVIAKGRARARVREV